MIKFSAVWSCAFGLFLSFAALGDAAPVGFEDPALLADVMAGKIRLEQKLDTKTEFRNVLRSFFNKVTPEQYIALTTDHVKYAQLFGEVKNSKTLTVDATKTIYDYWLDLAVKIGLLTEHFYPEIHQVVTPNPDAISEAKVVQALSNYKDKITFSNNTVRLIPYQGGILVEDDFHFILAKDATTGDILKKNLLKLFNRISDTFRKELKGTP